MPSDTPSEKKWFLANPPPLLPPLVPVTSSNIAAIGHGDGALYVEFKTGDIWRYPGVSADAHGAMLKAESVGKHFHAHIKSKFTGTKLDMAPKPPV